MPVRVHFFLCCLQSLHAATFLQNLFEVFSLTFSRCVWLCMDQYYCAVVFQGPPQQGYSNTSRACDSLRYSCLNKNHLICYHVTTEMWFLSHNLTVPKGQKGSCMMFDTIKLHWVALIWFAGHFLAWKLGHQKIFAFLWCSTWIKQTNSTNY